MGSRDGSAPFFDRVVKLVNTSVCKTDMHRFDSDPGLQLSLS